MKKRRLSISPIFLILFLFLHVVNTSNIKAQIVPAGSSPSAYVDIHNFSYACSTDVSVSSAGTINCDMIYENSLRAPLWAVAYTVQDDAMKAPFDPIWGPCFIYTNIPTPHSGIYVQYDNPLVSFTSWNKHDEPILNGWNPDIVIGELHNPGGSANGVDYILAVVYENNNGVEISTCIVNDIVPGFSPGPTMGNLSAGVQLNNPANGRIAKDIHIDLFGEESPTYRNQFIATWTEYDPNTAKNYIMAAVGDISNLSSVINKYQITPNSPGDPEGILPDVGAMKVKMPCLNCAPNKAYITYIDPSNSNALMVADLDVYKTSLSVNSQIPLSTSHTAIGKPRIDAKNFGNVVSGEATWNVVAAIDPGTGFYQIHNFNDAATPAVCTLNTNEHHFSPVVTGIGEDADPSTTGKVGETQFSIAYYSTFTNSGPGNGDIFANSIDISGGAITNTNYYEVNDLDLFQPSQYMNANDIPVAVASASDNGNDLLTVWYQGYHPMYNWGEFHYKLSGNSYAFKPTGTINISPRKLGIYPNPATNNLHINKCNRCDFVISDVTGKTILKGSSDKDDYVINIENFTPGMYIIDITKDDINSKEKFIKQ